MNDASQVLDNSEIIAITSKLLLIAIFQISDGIQVVVLGARFARCKNPMYITFVAYWVIGFPISYYSSIRSSRLLEGSDSWQD
jgi:MATE family multidrug resistance protein